MQASEINELRQHIVNYIQDCDRGSKERLQVSGSRQCFKEACIILCVFVFFLIKVVYVLMRNIFQFEQPPSKIEYTTGVNNISAPQFLIFYKGRLIIVYTNVQIVILIVLVVYLEVAQGSRLSVGLCSIRARLYLLYIDMTNFNLVITPHRRFLVMLQKIQKLLIIFFNLGKSNLSR